MNVTGPSARAPLPALAQTQTPPRLDSHIHYILLCLHSELLRRFKRRNPNFPYSFGVELSRCSFHVEADSVFSAVLEWYITFGFVIHTMSLTNSSQRDSIHSFYGFISPPSLQLCIHTKCQTLEKMFKGYCWQICDSLWKKKIRVGLQCRM